MSRSASMSSRGTTALPAAVSQTVNLAKMQKENPLAPKDERIKLTTEGRASKPLDLLIEHAMKGKSGSCMEMLQPLLARWR